AWKALALGDDEHALGLIALADRAFREWRRFVEKAVAEGDDKALERLGTVPLRRILEQALADARRSLPPSVLKRLEERAPPLVVLTKAVSALEYVVGAFLGTAAVLALALWVLGLGLLHASIPGAPGTGWIDLAALGVSLVAGARASRRGASFQATAVVALAAS